MVNQFVRVFLKRQAICDIQHEMSVDFFYISCTELPQRPRLDHTTPGMPMHTVSIYILKGWQLQFN